MMIKKSFTIIFIVIILSLNLIPTVHAAESIPSPFCPKTEDAIREILRECGLDEEENLKILEQGSSVHLQTEKQESKAQKKVIIIDSTTSNIFSEGVPTENLHTNFSELPIYDVVNGEYLLGSSGADLRILFIGDARKPTCSGTAARVRFVKTMVEELNIENARLFLLDTGKEEADAKSFAKMNPNIFVAHASGGNDIYDKLFFEVCRNRGMAGGRHPAICVLDHNCIPIYTTTETLFDEDEISEVLRPYAAVTQDNSDAGHSQASAAPFLDVQPNSYYADAVAWAVGQDITDGNSATTFAPDIPCTRAQTVTFLWRVAGSPTPQGNTNPFADVRAGSYYYNAVMWAVEQGITGGTSSATFSPDATVTRGQTVTFLYRAAGSPAVSGNSTFTDVGSGLYYGNAIQWAVNSGITAGTSATTFSPDANCTRAQIVTFLYRNRA